MVVYVRTYRVVRGDRKQRVTIKIDNFLLLLLLPLLLNVNVVCLKTSRKYSGKTLMVSND